MRLVSHQAIGSVARNDIFCLKCRYYGPKGGILGYWVTLIYIFNPIISYLGVKVYRVETMALERLLWNNGVSGKFNPSKYCGIYCTV